jgi:DNA-binding transcriptional MerR regulator
VRKPGPPGIRPVLKPGEVCRMLGIDYSTLHRYDTDGVLPAAFRTAGGRGQRRYWQDAVQEFLDNCKSTSENGE